MERLVIIGSVPPPFGGVSIHLERYIELNKDSYHIKLIQYTKLSDISRFLALLWIIFYPLKLKFYINHINKLVFLALLIRPFKKETEFYDHNYRYIESLNAFERLIFYRFIQKQKVIYIVNENIIQYYADYGLDIKKKAVLRKPFLPPILKDEEKIRKSYPVIISQIIHTKSPILTANAFRFEQYRNIDLYGIDLCIEITRKLKNTYPRIGFIFFVSLAEGDYYNELMNRVKKYKLEKNFFFITGNYQFWPILKNADIFIRPTYTDGDAISVHEALFFNKTVIASNLENRPNNIILFENRNSNDLELKVITALRKLNINPDESTLLNR